MPTFVWDLCWIINSHVQWVLLLLESPALLSYTVYFIFNLHWDSSQVKSRFLCIVPVFNVHFFGHQRTSSYHRFVQRNVQVPDFMIDSLRFSFQIYILSESYNNSSPSALLRFSVPDGHKKKIPCSFVLTSRGSLWGFPTDVICFYF